MRKRDRPENGMKGRGTGEGWGRACYIDFVSFVKTEPDLARIDLHALPNSLPPYSCYTAAI